jgi:hypothetical protein
LDAVKWRQRDAEKVALKTSLKVTPKDDPKRVAKVEKVDIKRTIKIAKKGRQKVALFNCVFLDTKREVAHCLSVFIIVIIYFDNFDMIL